MVKFAIFYLTKAVRYRLCHISIAPKRSKYLDVRFLKNAFFLSYQGGALPLSHSSIFRLIYLVFTPFLCVMFVASHQYGSFGDS